MLLLVTRSLSAGLLLVTLLAAAPALAGDAGHALHAPGMEAAEGIAPSGAPTSPQLELRRTDRLPAPAVQTCDPARPGDAATACDPAVAQHVDERDVAHRLHVRQRLPRVRSLDDP